MPMPMVNIRKGSRIVFAQAALSAACAGALVLAWPRKTPSLTIITSTAGAANARVYAGRRKGDKGGKGERGKEGKGLSERFSLRVKQCVT